MIFGLTLDLRLRLVAAGALAAACALGAGASAAAPLADIALPVSAPGAPASISVPEPTSSAQDPAAPHVYQNMIRYLASQQTFFVELNSTTTITGGDKIRKTGGLSRVWYRRPNHIVWTTQSDIGASAMAVNGETCTLYLPSLSRYMVSLINGSPDTQLAAMSAPYGLVTSSFFSTDTTGSLRAVLSDTPRLMADEVMLGVPCRHLVLPTRSGETHLWVANGMIPLPVKLSYGMSIPASPGENNGIESQTEVSFRWRVNVELPDSTFQLKIPETAVKAERLGSPTVMAKLGTGKSKKETKSTRGKARTGSSSRSGSSAKKSSQDDSSLGLAFEPPPNLDSPLAMRSALENGRESTLPSLQGTDDVVKAAIQGSKPDAVPSGASYQPLQQAEAPPPPTSAAKSPGAVLTLINGRQVDLGSFRGKRAVVLDFWATWCGPCRQSMPVVSQVAQAYRSRGVEFFAVNMAENEGDIQKYVTQEGMSVPVAIDPHGTLASAFGVTGIPHLVVIGKDGTVKGTHTGADQNLRDNLVKDLNLALQ